MEPPVSGFGECQECGGPVERVGWDDLCFSCQEDERAEQEARWERMDEEDAFLYGVPFENRGSRGGRWRG